MVDEIVSGDSLLAELAAEADRLGLSYSGNPDLLSEPVDAIDAMFEHLYPEAGERQLQKIVEDTRDIPHEITDLDDQPEDPEEMDMAKDTLAFFIEVDRPNMKHFEREFRAFLHGEDYSYSEKTIRHLISSVLGLD